MQGDYYDYPTKYTSCALGIVKSLPPTFYTQNSTSHPVTQFLETDVNK